MLRNASFALKLMLALAVIVLVGVGAVALMVNRFAEQHFQNYVYLETRPWVMTLAPLLADHYAARGNWLEVEPLLESFSGGGMMGMGRRRGMGAQMQMGSGVQPLLADAKGNILVDPSGRYIDQRLSSATLRGAQPIEVEGKIVGYLLTSNGPREQEFIESLNRSILWAGGLASLVAILLGVLLTRAVVRPLRVVRDAAKRIGAGDFAYRVPLSGGDEVGDLARQFNEMAAALERDEELRRTMMADIAHELRTPVSVIRGQVEALQDGVFELSLDNVAPIYDQALLLGRLIDDLRDLALAEAVRLPLEQTEVALGRLLARVVSAFQSQARAKRIELSTDLPQDELWVQGDAQRLEQVVSNLLSNALRYTPQGGAVRVRAWAEAGQACFAVQDTGVGLAPEELAHLFERFYRADRARTRAEGGTGLGLAIVRQLVEAHGGQISVESAPGQGATFTVRLPRLASR